ncbi:hypothetical protein RZQ54_29015, partial [Raoultella planticola]|uniref:hypothetical protein n=1 Tax=Raoultella planticola TaxID=575 RepID=UPI00292ACF82
SAQIREILISESAWEEMTCLFAPSLGSLLVFFKVGYFEFNWKETILLSLKKGGVIGFTLGLGLWVKARLQDRKDNKKNK